MYADLEKLRELIVPTTDEEARASMARYEASFPRNPLFVCSLGKELCEEYFAIANEVLAARDVQRLQGQERGNDCQ